MTFFENQARAKRNTKLFMFLYILAISAIILGIYSGIILVMRWGTTTELGTYPTDFFIDLNYFWHSDILITVAGIALTVILSGSVYKVAQLRGGGATVAQMLGGKLILPETTDPDEKRVLNVVEEMAIASGMKVPPVYVIEGQKGINAFAAGFSPRSAVIGVSQGSIKLLTREELQGVIAHEFSHIVHGDMGLNIRLMGVLHGILLIAIIGYHIMDLGSGGRRNRDSDGHGGIVAFGMIMFVMGYIGVFFANLIKMAVSRQREFLADAAAVQFTRYPDGIGGALKKIGGFSHGSCVKHPRAEEASHMYFADGLKRSFVGLFSTHPPLKERLSKIYPRYDGKFIPVALEGGELPEFSSEVAETVGVSQFAGGEVGGVDEPIERLDLPAEEAVINSVGTLTAANLEYAHKLLEGLPEKIKLRVHNTCGACAVVYGLLLDQSDEVRTKQVRGLADTVQSEVMEELQAVAFDIGTLETDAYLSVIDLALPSLAQLSSEQYKQFRKNLKLLIQADREITLFEYILFTVVTEYLDEAVDGKVSEHGECRDLKRLIDPASNLFVALAIFGNADRERAREAYTAAVRRCGIAEKHWREIDNETDIAIKDLDRALRAFADVDPMIKQKIIEACVTCVQVDEEIAVEERLILRAIADTMDCPLPPLG